MKPQSALMLAISLLVGSFSAPLMAGRAQGQSKQEQAVLGPGLYVFQTRTRGSSCGDAEPDGYVLSFVAAIDGVPGSSSMKMEVVNSEYFKEWAITVEADGQVKGSSRIGTAADAPESSFSVRLEGDRFKGTGARTYKGQGKAARCRVDFDALLRRLDR